MSEGSEDSAMAACLTRTRSVVLNVLIGVGLMIALSGWVIRWQSGDVIARPARELHDGLLFALIFAAAASYLVRRSWARRPASLPHVRLRTRFFRAHVGAAAVAAIGVPLGLVYGTAVDPSLAGVAPFWVVPLALGLLAIPRRGELEGTLWKEDGDRMEN